HVQPGLHLQPVQAHEPVRYRFVRQGRELPRRRQGYAPGRWSASPVLITAHSLGYAGNAAPLRRGCIEQSATSKKPPFEVAFCFLLFAFYFSRDTLVFCGALCPIDPDQPLVPRLVRKLIRVNRSVASYPHTSSGFNVS